MFSTSTIPGTPKEDIPEFPSIATTSDTYAHDLYPAVLEEREIEAFLEESLDYDTTHARWSIPSAPTATENLVNSFYTVLSSIVRRFVNSAEAGVERVLDNTYGIPECEEKNDKGYRLCPVLVLQATGPSFQVPKTFQPSTLAPSRAVGYSQMTSFFSVKPEDQVTSADEEVREMETYAQRILRTQPNRFFVRCLALTEKHARLIHFDRAGAEITPPIDIHKSPATLIRLVAGLSSTDERLLGIDTSIQWSISNGRKARGTLTTTGPCGEFKAYPILEQLRTTRDGIYGRATTCWRVQDPDTLEELVVKDSWRPDNRAGEYEFLEVVKGIPGVVQMISYETGRGETKDFRCPTTVGKYRNRVAMRVALRSYGPSIERFTSVLQMLCALRDAIAGHRELLAENVRMLHRDVAAQNILLGRRNAPLGERGILIDLDLAFKATDTGPTIKVDHNIGIRVFQSLSVLESLYDGDKAPVHTYLDDLESFFYLLAYLFLLYRPDGSPLPSTEEGPSIVWTWSEPDANVASANKHRFFGLGGKFRANRLVQELWGPVCGDLFRDFRGWMSSRMDNKRMLHHRGDDLTALLSQREQHYSDVLAMFDKAIAVLKSSTPFEPNTPPIPGPQNERSTTLENPEPSSHNKFTPSVARPVTLPAIHPAPSTTQCFDPPKAAPMTNDSPSAPQPTIILPSNPPPFTIPVRRSARLRELCPASRSLPSAPSRGPAHPSPTEVTFQPRRSARIQKRRLEEDGHPESPQVKARRIAKHHRVTSRSR